MDRAYILTDHGFVSLPEAVSTDDAEAVTRRWVAGADVDDGPGVLLDERAHLGYLDADVNSLADPRQRFRKRGLGDARFYHGGVLLQEFVPNFVTITRERLRTNDPDPDDEILPNGTPAEVIEAYTVGDLDYLRASVEDRGVKTV